MITLGLVDDHTLFRDGLKHALSNSGEFEVIIEASNGREYIDQLKIKQPDVTLLDISMPVLDGQSTSIEALSLFPDLKIIALSMFSDTEHYQQMVNAGVKGFLIKEARLPELRRGIYEVYEGGTYFSQVLLQSIISSITNPNNTTPSIQLTERENEVLRLICEGLSNKEISERIFVSIKTVEGYKTKLLEKTETKNSINLMLYALKNGIIDLDQRDNS